MTNFKETLVSYCQDECYKCLWRAEATCFMLIMFFTEIVEVKIGAYIVAILMGAYLNCLNTIQKQKEEVVKNNRLINIILSNHNSVYWGIFFSISFPLLCMLNECISSKLFAQFIGITVTMTINQWFSIKISNYFKNKLIIPKEEE